eukprot:CAMPEP_0114548600 /NCGR_PEP_ID=MMETSP0114-20121206/5070_1 /TAXON_ID=31324 /ORGANISM="Goniomonas sp, Strain m" /LENGTH=148 /DNA_ID=CAMNT_0001733205 /DNA_START=330 /DNA_END=776 /DNA_ORIENTATION=-
MVVVGELRRRDLPQLLRHHEAVAGHAVPGRRVVHVVELLDVDDEAAARGRNGTRVNAGEADAGVWAEEVVAGADDASVVAEEEGAGAVLGVGEAGDVEALPSAPGAHHVQVKPRRLDDQPVLVAGEDNIGDDVGVGASGTVAEARPWS